MAKTKITENSDSRLDEARKKFKVRLKSKREELEKLYDGYGEPTVKYKVDKDKAKLMIVKLHNAILQVDSAYSRLDDVCPFPMMKEGAELWFKEANRNLNDLLGLAIEQAGLEKEVYSKPETEVK